MNVFLKLPIYMIIPLAIIAIVFGVIHSALLLPLGIATAIYAVIAIVFYILLNGTFKKNLMDFAVGMESSQREFLEEMPVPYAVVDSDGKLYWYNNKFREITEGHDLKIQPISGIFHEIDKKFLSELDEDTSTKIIYYKEKAYKINIEKLSHITEEEESSVVIFALMFLDATETEQYRKRLEDDKLVVGNVFIDNYEDALNTIDDVKRSMLEAVVERKIRKYFGEADAIIRKIERDKFFIVFPNKYTEKLIENKFSILEDVKNTRVGNEINITLSIGLGLNGDSFMRNAEYAKSATNLALGRGGSQVVIKNSGEVTIFGAKGKEVEKNTRVKARVKALALKELMTSREYVLVMGHKNTDFDSLGAAVGLYSMAKELDKPCNIVLNTVNRSLRPMVDAFMESGDYPDNMFIDSEEALKVADAPGVLVIVVDTNRPEMTECPELLEETDDIVVFDHHRQNTQVIENPILSYVEPYASSTSEMVAELVQYFSENFKLTPVEADCIYTGMLIDTNNFRSKTGVRTFEAAAYLRRSGADVMRVRKLLREDMDSCKKRAEIVSNAEVYRDVFAFSVCDPKGVESPTVVGAQASNELLNIYGIKASFVVTGFENGRVYVSSRSIDEVDVQLIMERMGGGGHLNMAGAQIENSTVKDVIEQIKAIIDSMIDKGEIK